jgi:hypothetical protein
VNKQSKETAMTQLVVEDKTCGSGNGQAPAGGAEAIIRRDPSHRPGRVEHLGGRDDGAGAVQADHHGGRVGEA